MLERKEREQIIEVFGRATQRLADNLARPSAILFSSDARESTENVVLLQEAMITKYGVHIVRSTDADDERSELIGPFATEESARLWIARHPIQNARCNVMRVSRVEPWEWTKP
jgi:hypothetical protein